MVNSRINSEFTVLKELETGISVSFFIKKIEWVNTYIRFKQSFIGL